MLIIIQGGTSEFVKQSDMDPQILSKMLTNADTPLIDTLGIVLKALGHQLSIIPIEPENSVNNTYTEALEAQDTSAHVAENPTEQQ